MPGNGRFLYSAFSRFDSKACQKFFADAGLTMKVERGMRVFPASDKAEDVVNVLFDAVKKEGVGVIMGKRVSDLIICEDESGVKSITGVRLGDRQIMADAVIIATGGASYPLTGSDGSGYALAREAGHSIVLPRGALVPLETVENWPRELQGLSLRNINLGLYKDGKLLSEEFGEMLFTHFGVSGPVVLTLSRLLLDGKGEYSLRLNLKPALTVEQLDLRLQRDFHKAINKQYKNCLTDLLPRKLIPIIVRLSGIEEDKPVHSITRVERLHLCGLLTNLEMTVSQSRPIAEAIVTAGGVNLKEVDPKTMASKVCRDLYFAGELLDIDGYTGGFNLQAAFATGYVAGKAAAGFSS